VKEAAMLSTQLFHLPQHILLRECSKSGYHGNQPIKKKHMN